MRRTRRMTTGERWELGLFLTMLIVGCLLLTALLNLRSMPKAMAWKNSNPAAGGAASATLPAPQVIPQVDYSQPLVTVQIPGPLPSSIEQMIPAPVELPPVVQKPKALTDIRTLNGKNYRYLKTLRLRVTAYAPDPRCTFPYPGTTTATGASVRTNGGRLVAADPSLIAMHSLVVVPGYAASSGVPVLDTGGAIKGYRLDVLMPTFAQAQAWGSKMLEVKVYSSVK